MAVKLCGKHLVIHVGNVCAATDCDGTDEAMPTSSFRGLALECCSRGCSTEKISAYCCSPHMELPKAKKH
ncbi:hypothetical protein AAVH_40865 [Aphelenchoides avenae]|nr:hypothetical protein AAVH_40865 [Aphelenchus avenae]